MAYAHELSRAFFLLCSGAAFICKLRFACCIFYYSSPAHPPPRSPHGVCMCICIVAAGEFVKYLPDFSKNAKFVAI